MFNYSKRYLDYGCLVLGLFNISIWHMNLFGEAKWRKSIAGASGYQIKSGGELNESKFVKWFGSSMGLLNHHNTCNSRPGLLEIFVKHEDVSYPMLRSHSEISYGWNLVVWYTILPILCSFLLLRLVFCLCILSVVFGVNTHLFLYYEST